MEWHVWDFPDNIRIYFADEFRLKLFNKLKEICGSRYRLAKILKLHPMTVKEYELAKSSEGRDVFLPVSVLKKIIDILKKYECSSLITEIEKHIKKNKNVRQRFNHKSSQATYKRIEGTLFLCSSYDW